MINIKKGILIITYYFPPESSGGAARPYSLYKYLSRCGYDVFVVTQNRYGRLEGEKNIYRFDSLVGWRTHFTLIKFFYKLISKLKNIFGFCTESDVYWARNVLLSIDEIIRNNNIQLLYATYPTGEALNLGIKISKKYDLPLVSEFRDGLLLEPIVETAFWQKFFKKKFECSVMARSAAVVTVGKRYSAYFRGKYGREEVYTVYNGYDQDDFVPAQSVKPTGAKRKIVHFGALDASRKRDITSLYRALAALKKTSFISGQNFELSLIGRYTDKEKKNIRDYGLDDIIKIYASMDRASGLAKIAAEYDFLLLYGVPDKDAVIPGKLFEYLNLGKPIIGVCGGNESGEIIRTTGTGEVCDFDEESIARLFRKFLGGDYEFAPDRAEIEKYSREGQAGAIVEVLDKIIPVR